MTPLEIEIRAMIALDGPMPVARYMELCLGHPVHGYYMSRDPLGSGGDFTTAPEISQMFGELIGLWAASVWQRLGAPSAVNLVEFGPGRGTLMSDALRAAAILPEFLEALAVHLVEINPTLRVRQQTVLEDAPVTPVWHRDASTLRDGPMIAIANEFFDTLPVRQFVKGMSGWHERMVGLGPDDRLVLGVNPAALTDVAAAAIIPGEVQDAPFGSVFEWRSDLIVSDIVRRIVAHGGAALIIDYGHLRSAPGDTLQAVRAHAYVDPMETPGEADVTAHVDFAALVRVAKSANALVHGPMTQGDFLRRLGIGVRAERLKANATAAQARDIDHALHRLAGGGKGMGELFKAVAFSHPDLAAVPGFDHVTG